MPAGTDPSTAPATTPHYDREEEIHAGSGRGDERHVAARMSHVRGSTGTGLAHPKRKLPAASNRSTDNDGAEEINMRQGIYGETSLVFAVESPPFIGDPPAGHIHAGPWQRAAAALCTRGRTAAGKDRSWASIELREAPTLDLNQEERPIQRAVLREGGRPRPCREILLDGEIVPDRTRRRAFPVASITTLPRHIPAWQTASADFETAFSARRTPERWDLDCRQRIRRRRPRRRWIDPRAKSGAFQPLLPRKGTFMS